MKEAAGGRWDGYQESLLTIQALATNAYMACEAVSYGEHLGVEVTYYTDAEEL